MNDIILAIRNIANGTPPQIDISDILYNHNCQYLLSKFQSDNISETLAFERTVNQIANKIRYKTCRSVFTELNNAKIPYAVIKGAVISQMAYENPSYRNSADIDVLVSRTDADRVKNVLLSNGFVQGRVAEHKIIPFTREELIFQVGTSHQLAPFIKETGNKLCPFVNVDVNLDIMWGENKQKIDMEYMLSQTEDTELYGIKFHKLTPEAEFVSLCMHHYKDMNSLYLLWKGSLKLSLFSDIFFYLKKVNLNINKLMSIVARFNIAKYLYYCVYYTDLIFDSYDTKKYLSMLYTNDAIEILKSYGLDDEEKKMWNIGFFERLFCKNLQEHLNDFFSKKDKEKIMINRRYM